MRFWDSSALVPMAIEEERSASCRELLQKDPRIAVWGLTRTEMSSAVRRKERSGELVRAAVDEAFERITLLAVSWTEVCAFEPVCNRADRLLAVHPLRAADALQLAAALVLCQDRPLDWDFVTADDRLARAAGAEGFRVLVPA